MLDVSLAHVSFARGDFALHDINLTFPASTHTAIAGPPASGTTTLLDLIAGKIRPSSGEIRFGTRVVNDVGESRRPLLHVTSSLDVPERWSVRHALVAAVRRRTLDRIDRQREYDLAIEKWKLGALAVRTIRTLSSSERTLVHLARIELLRPGILVADRLLEHLNAAALDEVADAFFRTLRVAGTTVISAPSARAELGATDRVVVLAAGRVVQQGTAAQIYAEPLDEASALATGSVNAIPVTVNGTTVDSIIGTWDVDHPPFQGSGVALVRPEAFSIARPGEESDLIVAVEEATFESGRWLVHALLSGGITLRVSLPAEVRMHKGKLLALSCAAANFPLIERSVEAPPTSVPTDAIPPMSSSR
ncbi:MAG TPA: ATP-binding cassette domain-containing protein [Thermoanaerobaculia bacterium]